MENMYNLYAIPGVEMNAWLERFEEIKAENSDNSCITEEQIASMVNESFEDNENVTHSSDFDMGQLIPGMDEACFKAVIAHISPVKSFTSKKGRHLDLIKIALIAGDEEIELDVWNKNVQSWIRTRGEENIQPGDYVHVQNVNISEYQGKLNASWSKKTKIQVLEKEYMDVKLPLIPLAKIKKEGTYHVQANVLFIGEPQLVGSDNILLQKIVLTDDWEFKIDLCVWRDTLFQFEVGDKIDIHIDVSKYNNALNYNYNNEYEIEVLESTKIEMNTALMEEIESLEENEKVNITGRITRIYNGIPYDNGHITTWEITLSDDCTIDFTMFRETGRNYSPSIGDHIDIYNAVVSFDEYNYCKKLIHSYETLISLTTSMEAVQLPFVHLADIQQYADQDEYIDVQIHVVRKNNPITYQRMDDTSSVITHLQVCDDTTMTKMVMWGEQQVLLQYGGEYNLYNVKIKENFETDEFEVHADNKTRIEEAALGISVDKLYKTVDILNDDELDDLIAVEGQMTDLKIFEYPKCPACNGKLTETLRGYYCDTCKTEPAPRMLWKAEAQIEQNKVILWDEVIHHLIDPYVNREIDISEQIDAIKSKVNDEPHKYCGIIDYDEKTDTIQLIASAVI